MIALSSLVSVSSLLAVRTLCHLFDLTDLQRIDEMIDVVELLCGEATFQGYELLQRDYLDQERMIGVGFADAPQH